MIKQKLSILTKGLTLLRPSLRHKLSFPFSSVDQSLYYRPKVPVISFLNTHSLQHKESTQHYRIKYCPFCPKPHYEQPSNLYTLNIHKDSGVYFCFRCSAKGSWLDFQKNLLGITIHPMMDEGDHNASADNNIHSKISDAEYFIYRENLYSKQYQDVREYLHARGLGDDTLQAYNVGAGVETFFTRDIGQEINVKVVYFPMYRMLQKEQQKQKLLQSMNNEQSMNGEHKNANHSFNNNFTQIIKIKARGCGKENKKYMKQYPSSNLRGFFGLNVIKKEDTMVVITEGEFDAMAVYQATGIPAISLPHGAGNLPDSLLPFLDRFGKIVLWMDNDEAGRMNQEKIAYKLGVSRTHIVRKTLEDCKDANDVLLKDRNEVLAFINSARTIPDQNILQFSALRDAVRNRIFKMEEFIGVKLSWFRFFNRKVKGIRLAQLTIVSGPTGSGKTTLLSQISLQLAQYNVPVLWGSFQIRNEVLVSNMLTQFSKVNLTKHKEHFDSYADEFAHLPLYYLSFHGSHAIEKVLATISYAIEKLQVSLIVIDTLQFMLSDVAQGYRKFQIQDSLMSSLRRLATTYSVHIIIVIHPRKTEDGEDIGIHSIYGSSKAAQEADNIWMIQNRELYKVFDIKKNRFDGEIGKVAIGFDRECKSFFQLRRTELEALFNKEKTIEDIVLTRASEDALAKTVQQNEKIDQQFLVKKTKKY